MTTYVLATANPDKAKEIRAILTGIELEPRPTSVGDVEEDGETLLDNARLKARALVEATGKAAIADDTGLEVDALHGRPGVRSARYAGENVTYIDNQNKLIEEMTGCDVRTARFRTVAIVMRPDGSEIYAEGVVEGVIPTAPSGDGWGYDPVFVPVEADGRTFAEMGPDEKNAISHRGRAFRALNALIGSV